MLRSMRSALARVRLNNLYGWRQHGGISIKRRRKEIISGGEGVS